MTTMGRDHELIELAAKAAGITLDPRLACGLWAKELSRPWNPLEDDGDAMRLAVALRMELSTYNSLDQLRAEAAWAECAVGHDRDRIYCSAWFCENNNDPFAATRRAIVKAAAEIGRKLA